MIKTDNEIVKSSINGIPIWISQDKNLKETEGIRRLSYPHYHDEIEFLYIDKGQLKLICQDTEHILNEGETVFINSRVVHETFGIDPYLCTSLIQFKLFDYLDDIGKNMARFINLNELSLFKFKTGLKETEEINSIITQIVAEYKSKSLAHELYIKGMVYNLIGLLARYNLIKYNSLMPTSSESERLFTIIDYIDKNYSEKITLDYLASLVNLNSEYLCRLFKKTIGSTIGDYINFVRISKAEKLLSTTNKTISEISMDTGFASVSYFNRVFKCYKKCSPSAYKKIKFAQL
ncbi:MAG: helix-turn-helix transcriptional regulator [Clostridia bacterium]|nr:helix-turn-helix transcriptional regulator [Clostridia bacterium]